MVWRLDDPQGDEAGKVKWELVEYLRGTGLDLGCGPHKAYPHMLGVDSKKDVELFGIQMEPDYVVETCERLDDFESESCDFVFSSHLLEHIEDYAGALKEWWRVIKPGGYLALYLPHKELYPNIGEPGSNPDHKHDFEEEDIERAMCEVAPLGWDLVENQRRGEGMEYSFLQVYRKGSDFTTNRSWIDKQHPAKSACVVRYGGFGDQIMASSILPLLKEQGYHVTFMTTPKGHGILEHDPHIDRFIIQDEGQVPNHELNAYWSAWAPKFDRFINLCESIEGTLLAVPGRANHGWPLSVRRRLLDMNYVQWTHELAELEHRPRPAFYETHDEAAKAASFLSDRGCKPGDWIVLWALAGSSGHKFTPWQDVAIAETIKAIPRAKFVFVGDDACRILEFGWEEDPRVICASGELSIRQTLALAKQAHCVIGPETGVLNAVSHVEHIAKVVLLSHSSHENLTRDWPNTTALASASTPCYPCHQLHYDRKHCPADPETGAARCMVEMGPEPIIAALRVSYERRTTD